MSRALDLTQRQVKALCEGAKKAGYVPVIRVGKTVVELIPEGHAIHAQKKPELDDKGKGYL